ncbi:MAG: ABC transporter substrate-binding protein [Niabella sp.]
MPKQNNTIVSLVPSITETLYSLGLDDEVVGITKFCVHPLHWFQQKIKVGGTKNIHLEKIKSLQPTLIIANKEENVKEQVELLAKNYNVLLTDVNNYTEALQMIQDLGEVLQKQTASALLVQSIIEHFSVTKTSKPKTAAYIIWKNPWMTVGGDTFINDMMQKAGFYNVFENEKRYPQVSIEQIKNKNPDYLLLSSEPFPFQQKHADELRALMPHIKILLVDGEMFSWYGSRMIKASEYFNGLINW